MIVLDNVTKEYKGNLIFEKCNFTIPRGKTLLIGPNGIGKTTLLSMIYGLKTPNSGNISCDSLDSVKDIVKIREKVAYVPAEGDFPLSLTFKDLIDYASCFASQDSIDHFISLLEIEYLLRKYPKNMSSGERKLTKIALGLSMNRPLIILDEPLNNIDKRRKHKIIKILDQEKGDIIMTSHTDEFVFTKHYNLVRIKKVDDLSISQLFLDENNKNTFKIRTLNEEKVIEILREHSFDFEIGDGELTLSDPSIELFSIIFPEFGVFNP